MDFFMISKYVQNLFPNQHYKDTKKILHIQAFFQLFFKNVIKVSGFISIGLVTHSVLLDVGFNLNNYVKIWKRFYNS